MYVPEFFLCSTLGVTVEFLWLSILPVKELLVPLCGSRTELTLPNLSVVIWLSVVFKLLFYLVPLCCSESTITYLSISLYYSCRFIARRGVMLLYGLTEVHSFLFVVLPQSLLSILILASFGPLFKRMLCFFWCAGLH